MAEERSSVPVRARALLALARVELYEKRPERAAPLLVEALSRAEEASVGSVVPFIHLACAERCHQSRDPDGRRAALHEAERCFREMGATPRAQAARRELET